MGMEMLTFGYRNAVELSALPRVDAENMADRLARALADGWRVLSLFGLPDEGQNGGTVSLCLILAHDATGKLAALASHPLSGYASFTPDCPQVQYFERELHEQWGIDVQGHPWLKAVRHTPDRLPGGACYPFYQVHGNQVHEVAVGPIHAGVIEPGHFRFQCHGENVMHLEIALGYQHRGIEEKVLHGPSRLHLPHMECVAGDTTIAHATAHCVLVERLAGLEVPMRARLVRRIGLELERLANHCGDLGAIAGDTGFLPTSSWNGRIRGDFLNLTAAVCGNRFGRTLVTYGGTGHDLDAGECASIASRLAEAGRDAVGSVDTMLASVSVHDRLVHTGIVQRDEALQLGLVGVAARACGLPLDARFHAPLYELPLHSSKLRTGIGGDVLARTEVRNLELRDSLALVAADLDALAAQPKAECHPVRQCPALPAGRLAVAQVEGWRGEVCHIGVTGPDGRWLAYKIVDPSFHNWSGVAMALRGGQISDFPLCNKSFNLSYCGHDL